MRIIITAAVLPVIALAQVDRSALNDTVTDPNGARVPGAIAKAVQVTTGFGRETQTSSQGTCALDGLLIGRHTVVFSKPGFAEVRVGQVDQGVGQTRTLDLQLPVSGASASATVTEPLVRLDTAGVAMGSSIEQANLRDLPLHGRNWNSLSALAPGAIDNGPGDQRTIRFAASRAHQIVLFASHSAHYPT
jgi:hypothetical protein